MKIELNTNNMETLQCLSSKTRIKIIEILSEGNKNISELAGLLDMSSAIITRHINMLENAKIVRTEIISGKRGQQKRCELNTNELLLTIDMKNSKEYNNSNAISIPIGHFSDYFITPTCGLASAERLLGIIDDPRYFSCPERVKAALLWFQNGWVEYKIPSYLIKFSNVSEIEISFEICSEYPGYNSNHPSDIYFSINDIPLGYWICPGDFGEKHGMLTPIWWDFGTQHGLLKTIRINKVGTFIDGESISDTTISDIKINKNQDIIFRISSPKDTKNPGGVNLFGKGFGNYDQDINITIKYE